MRGSLRKSKNPSYKNYLPSHLAFIRDMFVKFINSSDPLADIEELLIIYDYLKACASTSFLGYLGLEQEIIMAANLFPGLSKDLKNRIKKMVSHEVENLQLWSLADNPDKLGLDFRLGLYEDIIRGHSFLFFCDVLLESLIEVRNNLADIYFYEDFLVVVRDTEYPASLECLISKIEEDGYFKACVTKSFSKESTQGYKFEYDVVSLSPTYKFFCLGMTTNSFTIIEFASMVGIEEAEKLGLCDKFFNSLSLVPAINKVGEYLKFSAAAFLDDVTDTWTLELVEDELRLDFECVVDFIDFCDIVNDMRFCISVNSCGVFTLKDQSATVAGVSTVPSSESLTQREIDSMPILIKMSFSTSLLGIKIPPSISKESTIKMIEEAIRI